MHTLVFVVNIVNEPSTWSFITSPPSLKRPAESGSYDWVSCQDIDVKALGDTVWVIWFPWRVPLSTLRISLQTKSCLVLLAMPRSW